MYTYRATVTNVVDGDTLDLLVDLGFKLFWRARFRVADVDTPEKGQQGWGEAGAFLRSLVLGKQLMLNSEKVSKFGYYLARITLDDGRDLTKVLLESGHAKPYFGGKKEPVR